MIFNSFSILILFTSKYWVTLFWSTWDMMVEIIYEWCNDYSIYKLAYCLFTMWNISYKYIMEVLKVSPWMQRLWQPFLNKSHSETIQSFLENSAKNVCWEYFFVCVENIFLCVENIFVCVENMGAKVKQLLRIWHYRMPLCIRKFEYL